MGAGNINRFNFIFYNLLVIAFIIFGNIVDSGGVLGFWGDRKSVV